MNPEYGKAIIYIGLGLILIGAIVWLFGNKLSWIGHLPGDIHIKKENVTIYFPITTMIIISITASLVFHLFKKMF